MYIGYMGSVVFVVSREYLLTPSDFQRSGEARWAEHDLILRKPVSQFKGPGLEKLSFRIQLRSDHGNIIVSPMEKLETLRQMRDTGAVFPLVIGGKPVTQNYWRIDSLSEGNNYFNAMGKLIQTDVTVNLTEYDDSNYVEEQTKTDKYGAIYNVANIALGSLGGVL